jgi:hypothetical protein
MYSAIKDKEILYQTPITRHTVVVYRVRLQSWVSEMIETDPRERKDKVKAALYLNTLCGGEGVAERLHTGWR